MAFTTIKMTDEFWQGREVHVFVTSNAPFLEGSADEDYLPWLDAGERERIARFTHDGGRAQYLCGRALLKSVLGRYLGVDSANVRFEETEHGKLFLLPGASHGIEFNMTHKPGAVACAVTAGVPVGIDLELYKPEKTGEKIARRFFSVAEIEFLNDYEGAAYARRFFQLWTLKEAYIKALGLGLKLPLKRFALIPRCESDAKETSNIEASFDAVLKEDPKNWQFYIRSIGEDVIVSLALKRGTAPDLAVLIEEDFRFE